MFSVIYSHITLIDSNELTGSIPTEIGLLTGLKNLKILGFGCKHLFSVLLLCFVAKHIHSFFASNLFSPIFSPICLIADNNELTGSIPTEIGLLTELTNLELSKQLFSVLLLVCLEIK